MHVSKNHLAGSFQEVPPRDLLDACKRTLFTGTISVHAGGKEGSLQLRAGVVDEARFDGAADRDRAVAEVCKLTDGMYEVEQLLPDLSGALASSAQLDGDVGDVPLASIMRHCEDNALSCTLIVVSGFDRGEVVYRTGEIKDVRLNGEKDEDAIVRLVAWKDARFRVQAAPLDPAIKGHPKVSREPTAPFRLGDAARAAEVGTAPAAPLRAPVAAPAPARAPEPTPAAAPAPAPASNPAPAVEPTSYITWVIVLGLLALAAAAAIRYYF